MPDDHLPLVPRAGESSRAQSCIQPSGRHSRRVADHQGEPTVWIDFDYGERKGLTFQYGLRTSLNAFIGLGRLRRIPAFGTMSGERDHILVY